MMTFLEIKRNFRSTLPRSWEQSMISPHYGERVPGVLDQAAKLIPNYAEKGLAALQEKSVMDWPEAVNVPLLMLHGANDEEVPATEALTFATKLSNLKRLYEPMVYADGVHEVAKDRRDRVQTLSSVAVQGPPGPDGGDGERSMKTPIPIV